MGWSKIMVGVWMAGGLAMSAMAQDVSVPYSTLNQKSIIGALGHPLGKVLQVSGTIQNGDSRSKAEADQLLLRVNTVNQKKLPKPVDLHLSFFSFAQSPMPKAGEAVTYMGYETGHFDGVPSEAFKWMPAVATTDFHFVLRFQVCKRLP